MRVALKGEILGTLKKSYLNMLRTVETVHGKALLVDSTSKTFKVLITSKPDENVTDKIERVAGESSFCRAKLYATIVFETNEEKKKLRDILRSIGFRCIRINDEVRCLNSFDGDGLVIVLRKKNIGLIFYVRSASLDVSMISSLSSAAFIDCSKIEELRKGEELLRLLLQKTEEILASGS